jgi:membrane protease YdiL (CAAX protease family)
MSGYDQSRDMPFGPVGERARIWHPIVIIIGSFLAFYLWALVPSVVLASMDAAAGKTDLMAPDALLVQYGLAALGISFALILLHFLFWTRVVERRPLTSIGMFRGGSLGQYLNGIAYGALFALIVSLAAFVAALHFGFSMPAMFAGTQGVLRPDVLLFAAMIVPVVLVQGGTEEVVFRGWMLSALSARTSMTLAVLLSSVAFGIFHVDRFVMDPVFAAIFISATIVLGAFLGVWAVQSGSIAGPAGFHGAYNALLFVTGYLARAANAKPGSTTSQIWADMMGLEAMQEVVRHTDYIAAMQTAVIAGSLIGIVALLMTRAERRELAEA